jgi:hypothetical protein
MENTHDIPWKRISAEGVAIVVSILLAFSIEAWWDERQELAEEREALESLYVEFKVNRDEVASVISILERAIKVVATLIELKQDEILELPAEAVAEMVDSMANPYTFDPVRGSIDALNSAGKLGILQDRELREALTTFVANLDDSVEDAYYMGQTSLTVWNEIAKNGGPWRFKTDGQRGADCAGPNPPDSCYINDLLDYLPVATGQELLRLRNNTVLMGYVNQNIVNAAYYSSEMRKVQIQIEAVLRALEKNL